jgi:hypothetical protein
MLLYLPLNKTNWSSNLKSNDTYAQTGGDIFAYVRKPRLSGQHAVILSSPSSPRPTGWLSCLILSVGLFIISNYTTALLPPPHANLRYIVWDEGVYQYTISKYNMPHITQRGWQEGNRYKHAAVTFSDWLLWIVTNIRIHEQQIVGNVTTVSYSPHITALYNYLLTCWLT